MCTEPSHASQQIRPRLAAAVVGLLLRGRRAVGLATVDIDGESPCNRHTSLSKIPPCGSP
jgi:hypothetical protein